MAPRSLKVLSLENSAMREKIELMRSLKDSKAEQQILLRNTLQALVGTFFRQSNLTSMNPLIQNNIYAPITLNYSMLLYAYTTHGVLQVAHDQPVLDALRGGLDLSCTELGPDEMREMENQLETRNIYDIWTDVGIWKRVFGGSSLIVNVDQDPTTPLDIRKIKKGSRLEFYDATRWELGASMKNSDTFLFYGERMDASRVLTQVGKRAPWLKRMQLSGWGMSEMERMIEPFNIYMRAMNAIYELLNEAKVDVYSLTGLNEQLGMGQAGQNMTQQRVETANQLKNYMNAILIDKEDEYTQKQIQFSGLAEMANQARITLAASLKMPLTKIFGMSATGFNSGEDDIENYNSMVESEVRQPMKPMIRMTLKLLAAAIFGYPYEINFKFKTLRVLKATEEETVKTFRHNRYKEMYEKGVLTAPEWAEMAHHDGIVNLDLKSSKAGAEDFPQGPMMAAMGGEFGGGDNGEGE